MLITWLIELFLNDLGNLKDEGDMNGHRNLQRDFHKFLEVPAFRVGYCDFHASCDCHTEICDCHSHVHTHTHAHTHMHTHTCTHTHTRIHTHTHPHTRTHTHAHTRTHMYTHTQECLEANRKTVYDLISSHGAVEDMVFFATLMKGVFIRLCG